MTEPKRVSLVWLMLAALVAVVIVFDVAYADDDHKCQGGHNCNDGGTLSGGDNMAENSAIISGSRSLAVGGSDMDIRGGYRSYSYLFGLIQETKSNPLEIARQLQAEGNYEAAAYLRCQPWGIHRAYGSKAKCIEMLSRPTETFHVEPMEETTNEDDEDEYRDDISALYAALSDLEAQRQSDADNARKAAIRPIPQPQTIIQEFIDEGKRAKLAALRGEE